jgi:hypothetical protein
MGNYRYQLCAPVQQSRLFESTETEHSHHTTHVVLEPLRDPDAKVFQKLALAKDKDDNLVRKRKHD